MKQQEAKISTNILSKVIDKDEFEVDRMLYLYKNKKKISINVVNIMDNIENRISNIINYTVIKENNCIEPQINKMIIK